LEAAGEIAGMERVSDTPRPATAVETVPNADPTCRCVHRHSCLSQAKPQRVTVNKKPHKVWVAVHTDGTILLSADMTVPYGIISLCVCDCQIYI